MSRHEDRTLFEYEKSTLRERVRAYMHENPAQAPLRLRAVDGFTATVSRPQMQVAALALILVLVGGSGTAFAAGDALPGQPLYGVKVNIIEPIQGSLATSAQDQATWNAELASRRLSEAESLAAAGKLTPSDAATIAGGLDQATEKFDASVASLATSSESAPTAANLESTMEGTLAAHTHILATIAQAVPSAAPTIHPLLTRVQTRALADKTARAQFDATASSSNIAAVKAAAQDQLDAVAEALSDVDSTTSDPIEIAVAAKANYQEGRENFNKGNYHAALETLQNASVYAKVAQASIQAAQVAKAAGVTVTATISATSTTATSTEISATSTDASSTQASSPPQYVDHRDDE